MDKNEDGSDQPGDGELIPRSDKIGSVSQSRKWIGLMRLFRPALVSFCSRAAPWHG